MAAFQNTPTIQRPVDDVFAFLADFENIPTWNSAILETRKTSPGPVGAGTTYRQRRSIPDRSEEGFEVIVFEPTSRLEIHGEIGPFTATISYRLAPVTVSGGFARGQPQLRLLPPAPVVGAQRVGERPARRVVQVTHHAHDTASPDARLSCLSGL